MALKNIKAETVLAKEGMEPQANETKKYIFSVCLLFRRSVLSKIRCFSDLTGLSCEIKEYRTLLGSYCVVTAAGSDSLLGDFDAFITHLKWQFN